MDRPTRVKWLDTEFPTAGAREFLPFEPFWPASPPTSSFALQQPPELLHPLLQWDCALAVDFTALTAPDVYLMLVRSKLAPKQLPGKALLHELRLTRSSD